MGYYAVEAGSKKGKFFKTHKASDKQSKTFNSREAAERYAKKKLSEGRPISLDYVKTDRSGNFMSQRPLIQKGSKGKSKYDEDFGRFKSGSSRKKKSKSSSRKFGDLGRSFFG